MPIRRGRLHPCSKDLRVSPRKELFQNGAVKKAGLALTDRAFLGQGQIEKETENAAHAVDSPEGQGQWKQRKGTKTTGVDGVG